MAKCYPYNAPPLCHTRKDTFFGYMIGQYLFHCLNTLDHPGAIMKDKLLKYPLTKRERGSSAFKIRLVVMCSQLYCISTMLVSSKKNTPKMMWNKYFLNIIGLNIDIKINWRIFSP